MLSSGLARKGYPFGAHYAAARRTTIDANNAS